MKRILALGIFVFGVASGAVAFGAVTSNPKDFTLPFPTKCQAATCQTVFPLGLEPSPDPSASPHKGGGPVIMPVTGGGEVDGSDMPTGFRSTASPIPSGYDAITIKESAGHSNRMQTLYLPVGNGYVLVTCAATKANIDKGHCDPTTPLPKRSAASRAAH
jgi:hypothetical protein